MTAAADNLRITNHALCTTIEMNAPETLHMRAAHVPDRLRSATLIALLAGAAGSFGFFLRAGRHTPGFLLVIMAAWVMSPFAALVWAHVVSEGWPRQTRAALSGVMLVVALGSVAAYAADAVWPRRSQPAAMFVLIPPVSWLMSVVVVTTAALIARRRS